MDEGQLTVARRELNFDQREFSLSKQQFESEMKQSQAQTQLNNQQLEFEKRRFESLKQQFYVEQQQLRQKFEAEKITFQHELQQQRLVIKEEQIEIAQVRTQLEQQRVQLNVQKKYFQSYLQQQLQSHSVPYNGSLLLDCPVYHTHISQELSDNEIGQESEVVVPSQALLTTPKQQKKQQPPPIVIATLKDMINVSNNRLDHQIEHYYQLSKKLHVVSNQLKKRDEVITQREVESKKCLRRNHCIQHRLATYCRFIKSRHHKIIRLIEEHKYLTMKSSQMGNELETEKGRCSDLRKQIKIYKKEHDEEAQRLDLFNTRYNTLIHSTPLEQALLKNRMAWDVIDAQQKLNFNAHARQYNEKKAQMLKDGEDVAAGLGDEPQEQKVKAEVLYQFTNLNKSFNITHSMLFADDPLLDRLYSTGRSRLLPILSHFFKRDFEDGVIPKLTHDLKLFFLSKDISGGSWVQFHGPGQDVDGSTTKDSITIFSLLNPYDSGVFKSTSDHDRCGLSQDECQRQHKKTDHNYESYHSQALEINTGHYQVCIKWE